MFNANMELLYNPIYLTHYVERGSFDNYIAIYCTCIKKHVAHTVIKILFIPAIHASFTEAETLEKLLTKCFVRITNLNSGSDLIIFHKESLLCLINKEKKTLLINYTELTNKELELRIIDLFLQLRKKDEAH